MTWQKLYHNFFLLILGFLGALAFFGSVVYLGYRLDWLGVIITIILAIIATGLIIRYLAATRPAEFTRWTMVDYLFLAGYGVVFCLAILALLSARTSQALISPWEVVPGYFFGLYTLGIIIIFFAIQHKTRISLLLLILQYFLTFSVAALVYTLGYGYDPFIHQASLKLIDQSGVIFPKTFYYLGQYSLEIIIHKIFFIPLEFIDHWLVPTLAAIFLPLTLNYVLKNKYSQIFNHRLIILSALLLPASLFIMTVPQNLAYLFLLLTVILSFSEMNRFKLAIIWSLSLAALMIHPIAGLPAASLAAWMTIKYLQFPAIWRKIGAGLLFLGNALIIPGLFYFLGQAHLSWSFNFFNLTWPQFPNQENLVLNFIYLLAFNKWWLALAVLILCGRLALKSKTLRFYFLGFTSLFISYLLSQQLVFNGLAENDQGSYPQRILMTAFIFLFPLAVVLSQQILERLKGKELMTKIILAVFTLIVILSSLYLAYPRADRYFNSHGYSLSASDIKAVQLIAQEAGHDDYIVLANQQVGVAAVREFGLKKYYRGDLFYYSIQTGYPLYSYYLEMLNTPTKDIMNKALDYVGVKEGYFVVDKYWWAAKKIILEAQLQADAWVAVDGGEVYVFKYSVK